MQLSLLDFNVRTEPEPVLSLVLQFCRVQDCGGLNAWFSATYRRRPVAWKGRRDLNPNLHVKGGRRASDLRQLWAARPD